MSKSWSQEKVEERLLPALKGLGRTYKDVAKTLVQQKIKGNIGYGDKCPIAKLTKKLFKSAETVWVDESVVEVQLVGKTYAVKPPTSVRTFINSFDNGQFPELEVDPYSEVVGF